MEFVQSNFETKNTKYIIIVIIILLLIICVFYVLYSKTTLEHFDKNNCESGMCQLKKKHKLCLYYTDWCGYCKEFVPEWNKFNDYVSSNNLKNDLVLEKYNCEGNNSKCKNVNEYPTVILYKKNGQEIKMSSDPRTKEGLLNFIKVNCYY